MTLRLRSPSLLGSLAVLAALASAPAVHASQADTTIFYSGKNSAGARYARNAGAYVMREGGPGTSERWRSAKRCSWDSAVPVRVKRPWSRLVGYSVGRLGPAYYLKQAEEGKAKRTVRSIVLLDPGAEGEFECDWKIPVAQTYATWLRQDSSNRLTVIAGKATAVNDFKGFRETYWNVLAQAPDAASLLKRVLVCDARGVTHDAVPGAFADLIAGPTLPGCPRSAPQLRWAVPPAASAPAAPAPSAPADPAPEQPGTPAPVAPPTAPAQPAPAAPSGVSETTGGVANTWTNYLNAGGYQGPTIASNQTVVIACRLTGFRVADGNTWWYRIASSPWNGAYYVSADAFYNNGRTSGSLRGTPFVDERVPGC